MRMIGDEIQKVLEHHLAYYGFLRALYTDLTPGSHLMTKGVPELPSPQSVGRPARIVKSIYFFR